MTAESHLTGERIHRSTHIFQSADDLVKKIQLDALNATYATTYEVGSTRDDGTTLPGYERSRCASGPRCK